MADSHHLLHHHHSQTQNPEEERNKNKIREKKARTEIAEIVPKTEDPSLHV
jgi:hypothetical protein